MGHLIWVMLNGLYIEGGVKNIYVGRGSNMGSYTPPFPLSGGVSPLPTPVYLVFRGVNPLRVVRSIFLFCPYGK